jgi:predicted MPP superfamily phosphohydrolase
MLRARSGPKLREVNIRIPGLPPDLNGIRISQLTDIHYGPFLGKRELEWAVAMANETRPHIALVTGDLITRQGDDLRGCLNVLKSVRGEAGVWACHGNHEQYAGVEDEATLLGERQGFHYLRGASEILRFGKAKLNLAGIDYHSLGAEPLIGAEEWLVNDALNVLLSHTPAAFDRAADLGFDLTISGHTHGGQVTLPLGKENLTFARAFTPYIWGLYERQGKQLYVSSGLGTVGVPVRIGADPEVTLIRLCAI